jgi:hypothetical protein
MHARVASPFCAASQPLRIEEMSPVRDINKGYEKDAVKSES